jgi:catechol 2,3-dioxygenase
MANTGDPDPSSASTRVGRVALRVNDLDHLAAFYRDVVGLAVLKRDEDRATLGADEPLLELLADPDASERTREETGLFHTAFRVPSREALGDALGRIREHWHLAGASDHRVSEALYLADPEGNGIELYRDYPRERWPIADDGSVGMETLSLDTDAIADLGCGRRSAPEGTTVGHVHLEVSSLSAARAFYVDALGLGVRQEWSDAALFVAAGDYHHHVGLNTWNGRTRPVEGRGLAWFELLVPSDEAMEATRERLTAHGVEVAAEDDSLALADPDGIALRLRADPVDRDDVG